MHWKGPVNPRPRSRSLCTGVTGYLIFTYKNIRIEQRNGMQANTPSYLQAVHGSDRVDTVVEFQWYELCRCPLCVRTLFRSNSTVLPIAEMSSKCYHLR